jgi:glycosyltransferase involved in cell wall biosynthesis
VWRLFRQESSVDVITTSITQSLFVTAVAAATGTHVAHLHAVHGGQTTNYGLKRVLAPLNVRFMAVSTHVQDILVDSGVPEGRIVIAENFLAEPAGSCAPSRESYRTRGPGAGGSPVRVVVVGRADPIKRLDMLVDAVATGELDDVHIDVFGYGPDIEMLRERAQPYDNLQFAGYDPDVPSRLAEADFFLHTCDVETFGLVVLEAFHAGVVALVPDSGGTGTLVDPDVTGLLYRAGDVQDMVRTIRRAAGLSSTELDRIAAAARNELHTRFSSEQGARVYRQAFEDAASPRRSRMPTLRRRGLRAGAS